eukprot:CAMPEP_0204870796 /NCGR_PEP_ID=MMETSP1348-20121228/33667_1 /ASSEMBLY_ACC=CAM_ASM_000700 /TAXON_ID=215587 /ORGANISM="Aplanochytrium stocchinoi, Strain GSBS06" /LENGTH=379 /DNA_ID=CAMNT_0052024819 /DNA_START=24 /DNA_END=1163 /DNA_ORIENTATION=-
MGAGGSSADAEARRRNKEIERQSYADFKEESHKVKLLLLGAGESGKSTVLKQMKLLYGKGFDQREAEVRSFLTSIVTNMKALVDGTELYGALGDAAGLKADKAKLDDLVTSDRKKWKFPMGLKESLVKLWNDEGLQEVWANQRNMIQVQDNLEYFMKDIDRVFAQNYVPTESDWLRVRVRTSGVVREVFKLDGVEFHIWDVGGQRNERRKWIHVFDNVQALIFFGAINEYDQRLFENNQVNRIQEALELFETVANDEIFDEAGLILFLNKSDLYADKLNKSPIRYIDEKNPDNSRFPDFKGPYCPVGEPRDSKLWKECHDAGIDYFEQLFMNRNHKPSTKSIYSHVTCAMDQGNIDFVFGACKGIVLEKMLTDIGMIRK